MVKIKFKRRKVHYIKIQVELKGISPLYLIRYYHCIPLCLILEWLGRMIRCIISILFPSFLELRGCNKIWLSFNNILIWLSLWWYSRVKCGIHNGSLCISRWNVICVWYSKYDVNGTSFIYLIVFFFAIQQLLNGHYRSR